MEHQNLLNARSSAYMLCEYLDTAIRNNTQGYPAYEQAALNRAYKVLDDIVASLNDQTEMVPVYKFNQKDVA